MLYNLCGTLLQWWTEQACGLTARRAPAHSGARCVQPAVLQQRQACRSIWQRQQAQRRRACQEVPRAHQHRTVLASQGGNPNAARQHHLFYLGISPSFRAAGRQARQQASPPAVQRACLKKSAPVHSSLRPAAAPAGSQPSTNPAVSWLARRCCAPKYWLACCSIATLQEATASKQTWQANG